MTWSGKQWQTAKESFNANVVVHVKAFSNKISEMVKSAALASYGESIVPTGKGISYGGHVSFASVAFVLEFASQLSKNFLTGVFKVLYFIMARSIGNICISGVNSLLSTSNT